MNSRPCTIGDDVVYTEMAEGASANDPRDPQGRTYHLETKVGQCANRMILVGSLLRAGHVAEQLLEPGYFDFTSQRYVRTITGFYKTRTGRVPMTIVGTGMGVPMTDFALRECANITSGSLAFIRVGTCGCVKEDVPLGDAVVADDCIMISRNPDGFRKDSKVKPYRWSMRVKGSEELLALLKEEIQKTGVGAEHMHSGLNGSCCSFYSSQDRQGTTFEDKNIGLVKELCSEHPDLTTLEMETFHIYDLARCARRPIHGAGVHIVLAQRVSDAFLDMKTKKLRERQLGVAAAEALCRLELEDEMTDGVWLHPRKEEEDPTPKKNNMVQLPMWLIALVLSVLVALLFSFVYAWLL